MSAPIVSGVAGLLLANNPKLTFDELRSRLLDSADPGMYSVAGNSAYNPKVSGEPRPIALLGQGIVDASAAWLGTIAPGQPPQNSLKRVSSDCGTIKLKENDPPVGFWIILLLPLIPVALTSRLAQRFGLNRSWGFVNGNCRSRNN